jgi:hypothetical protein
VSGAIKTAIVVAVVLGAAGAAIAVLLRPKPPAWVPTAIPVLDDPADAADEAPSAGSAAAAPSASYRKQAAPLSSAQLGAPLVNGAWVTACGAPATMKVVVKADVRGGHAVKVAVKTDPPDPAVTDCVTRAAKAMQWDASPRTGHVTVTY